MSEKREVVSVFRKGKFDSFVMINVRRKGNREILWHGVRGICVEVQENESAREGVTVLLNNMWYSAVFEF